MNLIYSAGFAAIMACGVYLLLSRHVMRIVYGVILISASVNLVLFLSGRIGPNPPPVIPSGERRSFLPGPPIRCPKRWC